MSNLLYLIYKDYLLLWRDKIGLCVLFFMPMFFVFTITILQSGNNQETKPLTIVVANFEKNELTQKFKNNLSDNKFSIKEISNPNETQLTALQQKVSQGIYQLLITIPQGTKLQLAKDTQQSLENETQAKPLTKKITLLFDPAINPALKQAMVMRMLSLVQTYKLQVMKNIVNEVLGMPKTEKSDTSFPINIEYAKGKKPNPVQQNIPAWALFGMFFIALPLASIMIKERDQRLTLRIHAAPISLMVVMLSRIITFISVNFLQLWLMLGIGLFIMPLMHLPALNVSQHIGAMILLGLLTSFAATSFGLFMGAFLKTMEQASALIPILIVLAAAVGGIMIPSYLMPASMQIFSNFSPLYWGHQAFVDVLLRDFTLWQILPSLTKLSLFSLLTCALTWWRYKLIWR